MHPRLFSFVFISGHALRNEKARAIPHCPKVRSQRDDSEMASDTRQRARARKELASSAENVPSLKEWGGYWEAQRGELTAHSHPEPHKARPTSLIILIAKRELEANRQTQHVELNTTQA